MQIITKKIQNVEKKKMVKIKRIKKIIVKIIKMD